MGGRTGGAAGLSRVVVTDTGPVLHLHEAEAFDLLAWTGQVLVPPAVDLELQRRIDRWPEVRPSWLTVEPLSPGVSEDADAWLLSGLLDAGEAQALALARYLQADWLLTDDATARLIASQIGLEVHGSLGVVLGAAAAGALDFDHALRALSALFDSSLWVSARVRHEARTALSSIFRRDV